MSKLVRLVDFQVFAPASGLDGKQRVVNEALFTTYESVRLWLKERKISAPFGKVLVTLADETTALKWHGHVANAIGICEVTEAVALPALIANAGDHRWVIGLVQHALGCIAQGLGWRSEDLDAFVVAASSQTLPLVHFFERLARVDKPSGLKCVPWFSVRPGETQVGVRIGDRDVAVISTPGPLYLEDTFPIAKTAIRDHEYVLLDKANKALASVAIVT